jgi:hypothetical protein
MKAINLLIFYFTLVGVSGQSVALSPKLFSLRNARLSLGGAYGTNFNPVNSTSNSSSNDEINFQDYFTAHRYNVAKSVNIGYIKDASPLTNLGLSLDLYAPNSFTSIYSEANYALYSFGLGNNAERFDIHALEIPVFLKLRFGKIHDKVHFMVMPGYGFGNIVTYQRNAEKADKTQLTRYNNLQATFSIDYGFNFNNYTSQKNKVYDDARVVVFFKGIHRPNNFFNTQFPTAIINGIDNSSLNFQELNVITGMQMFFKL